MVGDEAGKSTAGIILAGVSLVGMPLLAWANVARDANSPIL